MITYVIVEHIYCNMITYVIVEHIYCNMITYGIVEHILSKKNAMSRMEFDPLSLKANA
jgi:hypothetical protein